MPWYSWNTANVGVNYQSINQSKCNFYTTIPEVFYDLVKAEFVFIPFLASSVLQYFCNTYILLLHYALCSVWWIEVFCSCHGEASSISSSPGQRPKCYMSFIYKLFNLLLWNHFTNSLNQTCGNPLSRILYPRWLSWLKI